MISTASVIITPELLALVAEIDEFKGAWRALGTLAPERLSALRRVATIESIGSSTRIEGSRLSDRDVERLLANLEIKAFASRDEKEVAGYAEVMETVFAAWPDLAFTENHIRQLHRDLLVYSEKDAWHRGSYKTTSNSVAAFDETGKQLGIVFETASPFETPPRMEELIAWLGKARSDRALHPLLIVAVFVAVFLEIHPFQDGNGRLSRVLTTLLLLQAGYAYVSYSSLESVIEQSKEGYHLALRQTQGTIRADTPDWQPWLRFFLRALQQQMRRLAEKVEREKLLLATMPELALRIVDHPRPWASDNGRCGQADRRQPQHAEGTSADARRAAKPRPARRRPRHLVHPALGWVWPTGWAGAASLTWVILPRFSGHPCLPFGACEACLMSATCRVFPEAFKRESVDRVATSGLSDGAVARELGLHETVLRR